jgi:hypothetical protein
MSATLALSRTQATVGDPIAVTVALEAPAFSTVRWTNPAPAEGFLREAAGPWRFQHLGATWKLTRQETWAAFRPNMGAQLGYQFRVLGGGRVLHEARLVSPAIRIVSVIPKGEKIPKPAPLADPAARAYLPWPAAAAAGLLLAVAALFAFFLRRRRPGRPAESPEEAFQRELARLDARIEAGTPAEGFDEFYDRLAEATRRYLEEVLGFPARRETSSEIVRSLRRDGRGLPATEIDFTLLACDEYRYARREVRRERAREAVAAARRAAGMIHGILAPPEQKSA